MSGIKKRWVRNYLLIIMIIAILVDGAFLFTIRRFYYNLAQENLSNRMTVLEGFNRTFLQSEHTTLDDIAKLILQDYRDQDVAELQILNPEGRIFYSSTGFQTERLIGSEDVTAALKGQRGYWVGPNIETGEQIMGVSTALRDEHGNTIGVLRYISSMAAIDQLVNQYFLYSLLVLGAILILLLILSLTFSRSILGPINEITVAAERMAKGQFDEKVETRYKDELGVLAQTLNYMADEIQQSERLKNDFISSISHEIRTPLTAVKGWSETILTGDLENKEEVEKGLQVIMRETSRLSDMVEELLDFSRIEGGRMTLHKEQVDLSQEIMDIVAIYGPKAEGQNVMIETKLPDRPAYIVGDANRIKQVMINILDNAVKFSKPQGIITISMKLGEEIALSFIDQGTGISREDLENVRKKFYKGTSKQSGSGLGLAITDEIVALHDGRMEIDSIQGQGTTVTVHFPAVEGS